MDENQGQEDPSSAASGGEKENDPDLETERGSGDTGESEVEDKKPVPYYRFDEVVRAKNELQSDRDFWRDETLKREREIERHRAVMQEKTSVTDDLVPALLPRVKAVFKEADDGQASDLVNLIADTADRVAERRVVRQLEEIRKDQVQIRRQNLIGVISSDHAEFREGSEFMQRVEARIKSLGIVEDPRAIKDYGQQLGVYKLAADAVASEMGLSKTREENEIKEREKRRLRNAGGSGASHDVANGQISTAKIRELINAGKWDDLSKMEAQIASASRSGSLIVN